MMESAARAIKMMPPRYMRARTTVASLTVDLLKMNREIWWIREADAAIFGAEILLIVSRSKAFLAGGGFAIYVTAGFITSRE